MLVKPAVALKQIKQTLINLSQTDRQTQPGGLSTVASVHSLLHITAQPSDHYCRSGCRLSCLLIYPCFCSHRKGWYQVNTDIIEWDSTKH